MYLDRFSSFGRVPNPSDRQTDGNIWNEKLTAVFGAFPLPRPIHSMTLASWQGLAITLFSLDKKVARGVRSNKLKGYNESEIIAEEISTLSNIDEKIYIPYHFQKGSQRFSLSSKFSFSLICTKVSRLLYFTVQLDLGVKLEELSA